MEKDLEMLYQEKIKRLEEDIAGLRMSRRIMMTLLEQTQISCKSSEERLYKENKRLNKQVSAYAKELWQLRTGSVMQESSVKEK